MSVPLVHLRGLRKRFGRRAALAGIDLRVDAPEILGVVGPDGAGKTTLLRTLAGLLEIEAEQAMVLGVDLRGDVTALKARLGYVPQAFSLHRELSVAENLRFTARLHRLSAAVATARMDALLARTALAPFADRAAGALSGGMRQKLAIANALLPAPALLVLDEPTAGVDVLARGEIWALLAEARAEALVVLSTSYLDEAARCDRLVCLDGGRVVAEGSPAALRAGTALALYRLWGDDPRAIAHAVRAVTGVDGARATGSYARVEVRPGGAGRDALAAVPGVRFVEAAPLDMEAVLRALDRPAA